MKKYPSIEQFRSVIRVVKTQHDYAGKDENGETIYSHLTPYPKLKFKGTVKVHGTNAGIILHKNSQIDFQSRERVLSLEQDNAGFMLAMMGKQLDFLWRDVEFNDHIAVYGEWSGGNIQKGVAINGLPKMFIIFGVKVDDVWLDLAPQSNEQNIYHITQFPTYEIEIDFENPELSQNKLIEMTLEVEKECPVGKYFGVSGIGEGLVFTCETDKLLFFKSKGELHSSSKVKTINAVDVESLEGLKEFVEMVVTENRLNQGLGYLTEMGHSLEFKSIGEFLSWVVKDVIKEETDTIIANQFDVKRVKSAVNVKARMWFLNRL
jgi:RNA ligase